MATPIIFAPEQTTCRRVAPPAPVAVWLRRALVAIGLSGLAACGSRGPLELGEGPGVGIGGTGGTANGGSMGAGGARSTGGGSTGGAASGGAAAGGSSSGGALNPVACASQGFTMTVGFGSGGTKDVTGLAARPGIAVASYNAPSLEGPLPHWMSFRDGELRVLLPPLVPDIGETITARGVAIDGKGQVWAALERGQGDQVVPLMARIDPPSDALVELRGAHVLDFATDDLGFAYVLSESLDGRREVAQFDLDSGQVTLLIAPQPGANLVAMGVSRSGMLAVGHMRGVPGSSEETWRVSLVDLNGDIPWEKELGCRTGMLGLGVDASDSVYVVGPSTCELPNDSPVFEEPRWEDLPRAPTTPTLVQKLDARGQFAWALQVGDVDYRATSLDLDFDNQGLLFLQTSEGFEGDERYDTMLVDAQGNLIWSRNDCGRPTRLASDGQCDLYLAGEPSCSEEDDNLWLQYFEGERR